MHFPVHFDLSHFDLSQVAVIPDLQQLFAGELLSFVTTVVVVALEVCAFTHTVDPKNISVIETSITAKNSFFMFFLLYVYFFLGQM